MPVLTHLRSLRNSPTSARDLSQILSPIRLAVWFTFFNLAVAIAFATLFSFISYANEYPNSGGGSLFTSVGLGQMFASVLFFTTAVFLTIFVPIRIFGIFLGSRTLRYFDQIVISGISPARYIAGKIILQNLFFLIVLAASIPYLALCFALGGVSIPFVIASVFTLWLYTNLLTLVTLTASVFTFEVAAVPAVIVLFGVALWIGIFPVPPHPFNFTPSPIFASPVFENLLTEDSRFVREFGSFYSLTTPFGILGTHTVGFALTVTFLAALLLVLLSIGPLGSISGPLTNFGTVVMPGDSKKKSIFRGRNNLRRRGEIAFFYENRPARLRSLDLRLRWGIKECIFLFLLIPPITYLHIFAPVFWAFEFYAALLTVGSVALLVNAFIFTRDRFTANLHYPKWSAASVDTAFFLGNTALVVLLVFALPAIRKEYFTPITFSNPRWPAVTFGENLFAVGLIVALCGITFFSIVHWITARFWNHFRAFATAIIIYGFAILLPIFVYAAVDSNYDIPGDTEEFVGQVATVSPIIPLGHLIDERALRLTFEPSVWPFVISHLLAAAFFFRLAHKARRRFPPASPS